MHYYKECLYEQMLALGRAWVNGDIADEEGVLLVKQIETKRTERWWGRYDWALINGGFENE